MNKKELQFIIQEKEGQFIEFKKSFDSKNLAKEIVAFANASGGKIYLGIEDDGNIAGIKITNKLKSQIQDLANNCDPSIVVDLEELENILIINVKEGENKPFACSAGFYMRIGPNSQKIKRDEILKLAIKGGKIRFDEQICKNFDWQDFDEEKFKYYLKLSNISYNLKREEILKNLKILTVDGFTNAGVLFFAKEPYKYIWTSKIRCVHFNDDKRVDILDKKEVDRGIVGNIEFAINYLKELVPIKFEIKDARRIEHPDYPIDAYREVIVNAVVHRDYFASAEVAVEKLKNSIIINNPGGLLFEKEKFGNFSFYRNMIIADLLSRTIFMEKAGTGIKRIRDYCSKNKNKIKFDFDKYCFFIVINSKKTTPKTTPKTTSKTTPKNEDRILLLINENSSISKEKIAKEIGVTIDGVKYYIKKFKNKGVLKWIGPPRGGRWKVANKNKKDPEKP